MTQEMLTKEERFLSPEAIEFCRPTQKEMDSDLVSIGVHRDRVNDLCDTALAYHDQKEINKELYEALSRASQYLVFAYQESQKEGLKDSAATAKRDFAIIESALAKARGENQ